MSSNVNMTASISPDSPTSDKKALYHNLFNLITEENAQSEKIISFLNQHSTIFQKAETFKELGIDTQLPIKDYCSPYILADVQGFFASMNYFHLAVAALCEPIVLEKLRTQLNIDLNNNPMIMIQDRLTKLNQPTANLPKEKVAYVVGITDLFTDYYGNSADPS